MLITIQNNDYMGLHFDDALMTSSTGSKWFNFQACMRYMYFQ